MNVAALACGEVQDGHRGESKGRLQDLPCREKGRVSFKISLSYGESDCSKVEASMEQPTGMWRHSSSGCSQV